MKNMEREAFLAAVRDRALEYYEKDDLAQALASLYSDMNKHPAVERVAHTDYMIGMHLCLDKNKAGLRAWIVKMTKP